MAAFAHQGGWDELLFVAVPVIVLVGLVALANRRADRLQEGAGAPQDAERDVSPD